MEELIKKYLQKNVSLIGSRPVCGKMPFMSKLILELLNKKRNVLLFGLEGTEVWYTKHLLHQITKLDINAIQAYLSPCLETSKKYRNSIDKTQLLEAIEFLQQSNLILKDYQHLNPDRKNLYNDFDLICNMIKDYNDKIDIVIVDKLEDILKDTNISLEKTLKQLKNIALEKNIKILLFTNLSQEFETTKKMELSNFKEYHEIKKFIDTITIILEEEYKLLKQ